MNEARIKKIENFKQEVEKMEEHEVFLSIESIGGIVWREKHAFNKGRLEISLEDFQSNQEYYFALQQELVKMLPKFGVDPETTKDPENGAYWKWYAFWKNWMKDFSDTEWRAFDEKLSKKEDVKSFLPKKKWNE